jgi:hypothetical protein
MPDLPYQFEPAPGLVEYKVTSLLKDYLALLMNEPGHEETIEQILTLIRSYVDQLRTISGQNPVKTAHEVNSAVDGFFTAAAEESKTDIQCRAGCTACCYIEIDISRAEAAAIGAYCIENGITIDREYLAKQISTGRKTYSDISRCAFLKDNLCSIYPVRPVACRKHWVKTDPVLCDFSNNKVNPVGGYFDINTEILASALLNIDEAGPLEKMILDVMEKNN